MSGSGQDTMVSSAVEVVVDPDTAFAAFTEELDLWWVRQGDVRSRHCGIVRHERRHQRRSAPCRNRSAWDAGHVVTLPTRTVVRERLKVLPVDQDRGGFGLRGDFCAP
jgi:hypothetical protein